MPANLTFLVMIPLSDYYIETLLVDGFCSNHLSRPATDDGELINSRAIISAVMSQAFCSFLLLKTFTIPEYSSTSFRSVFSLVLVACSFYCFKRYTCKGNCLEHIGIVLRANNKWCLDRYRPVLISLS